MDPIVGGLITGGASLLGNIFSANTSAANTQAQIAGQESMQMQAQAFNEAEAAKTRQFQAQQINQQDQFQASMSNTAYQRARADMLKAGLNPILAASQGGASTPSGGAAGGATASIGAGSFPMVNKPSPFANLGDAVSKVISSAGAIQGLTTQRTEQHLNEAREENVRANSVVQQIDAINRGVENDILTHEAGKRAAEEVIAHNEAITAANRANMNTSARKAIDVGSFSGQGVAKTIEPITNIAEMGIASAFRKRMLDQSLEVAKMGRRTNTFSSGPAGDTTTWSNTQPIP